jgi:PAS domain S-box-containing protein
MGGGTVLLLTRDHAGGRKLPGASRTALSEAIDQVSDEAPSVVVVDAAVERQAQVGRTALRRWPTAKILFLTYADQLPRLQKSLPFMPELAGAVAVASDVGDDELGQILEQLAEAAERDRAISGLYRKLNSQVETLTSARSTLHERHSQLVLAERYLATVLEHAPQALISTDVGGVIATCNQFAAELFGFSAADCAGVRVAEHFTPASRPRVAQALSQAAAGRSARCEAEIALEPPVLVDFAVAPVLGADGHIAALSLALLDVTERKRIETALADTNRRLNAVLNNATVSIFLMDDRQQCVYMNDAAERLTGFRWEETRGRALHDVIHHTRPDGSHYPRMECPIDRAFPENHQTQGEDIFVHKDGRFYPVAFTASPIHDEDSRTIGTIIEVRDISEEKRNAQARELLMREVDHRARNVLAVAQSMVQLTQAEDVDTFRQTLLGRVTALARAQSSLAKTAWEGARLRDVICDELEAFGRPDGYDVDGPDLMLAPEQVQPLSMIVHELATNAAKYGGFSAPEGRVMVTWTQGAGGVELTWQETGGPRVREPSRKGFGSRLIANLLKQLRATADFDWRADGLRLRLTIPRPS